jgi:hypothetical protein
MRIRLIGHLMRSTATRGTEIQQTDHTRTTQGNDMKSIFAAFLTSVLLVASAGAQSDSTLPPTVANVVLLLKSYVPDTAKTERLRAEFNKPVPEGGVAL